MIFVYIYHVFVLHATRTNVLRQKRYMSNSSAPKSMKCSKLQVEIGGPPFTTLKKKKKMFNGFFWVV